MFFNQPAAPLSQPLAYPTQQAALGPLTPHDLKFKKYFDEIKEIEGAYADPSTVTTTVTLGLAPQTTSSQQNCRSVCHQPSFP